MKRFSLSFLRDMFVSVNNHVNGFERSLKGGRFTSDGYLLGRNPQTGRLMYSGTKGSTTTFGRRNGAQECARRRRQMGLGAQS
jgi:hypothetical protein